MSEKPQGSAASSTNSHGIAPHFAAANMMAEDIVKRGYLYQQCQTRTHRMNERLRWNGREDKSGCVRERKLMCVLYACVGSHLHHVLP